MMSTPVTLKIIVDVVDVVDVVNVPRSHCMIFDFVDVIDMYC